MNQPGEVPTSIFGYARVAGPDAQGIFFKQALLLTKVL